MEDDGETQIPTHLLSGKPLAWSRQLFFCGSSISGALAAGIIMRREPVMQNDYESAVDPYIVEFLPYMGDVFGAVLAATLLFLIGRKYTLIVTNILFLIPLLIFQSELPIKIDFAASIMWRVATRCQLIVSVVFVAEVAEASTRAFFTALFFLSYQCGFFIAEMEPVGETFHIFIALMGITIAVVISSMVPETPHWLAVTGRRLDAEDVLAYLRGDETSSSVEEEATEMFEKAELDVEDKELGVVANVFSSKFSWRLIIMTFVYLADNNVSFLLNPTTLNMISADNPEVQKLVSEIFWKELSFYDFLKYLNPVVGCALFCGLCLIVGRRIIYFSTIILSCSLLASQFITTNSRIPLYMITLSYLFSYTGGKQIPRILSAEIFPAVTRDLGVAICELIDLLLENIETLALSKGVNTWYYQTVERIRWALIPVGLVFSMFYMPETINLTLTETEYAAKELQVLFDSDILAFYDDEEEE